MTNIVTLDIFGLGYAGQIWWPTMEVELTKKSPQDTAGAALHTWNCDWRWKTRTKLNWWNRWCILSFSKQRPTLSFLVFLLSVLCHDFYDISPPKKSPSHLYFQCAIHVWAASSGFLWVMPNGPLVHAMFLFSPPVMLRHCVVSLWSCFASLLLGLCFPVSFVSKNWKKINPTSDSWKIWRLLICSYPHIACN